MTDRLNLSVVMPTMNKAALLERSLAALARQVVPEGSSWEVVVVDDGSTDGTAAVLSRLAASFPVPLKTVSAVTNVGRARARNMGLAAADGTWILFLDDDILAPGNLIAAHLELLAGDTNRGTIGYAVTDPDLVDAPHFHYLDSRGVAKLGSGSAPARYFVTQNATAPRWALQEVGGFQESFSAYGFEDMELAFRLEDRCGVQFKALVEPVPLHIHHHSLDEYLAKKVECGRHSLPLLAELHPERLVEMKLHYIIDSPGRNPGWRARLLRTLLDSPAGGGAGWMVSHWPRREGGVPRWRGLYFSLMNLAVLACYRHGLNQMADRQNPVKTMPK